MTRVVAAVTPSDHVRDRSSSGRPFIQYASSSFAHRHKKKGLAGRQALEATASSSARTRPSPPPTPPGIPTDGAAAVQRPEKPDIIWEAFALIDAADLPLAGIHHEVGIIFAGARAEADGAEFQRQSLNPLGTNFTPGIGKTNCLAKSFALATPRSQTSCSVPVLSTATADAASMLCRDEDEDNPYYIVPDGEVG